MGTLYKRKGRNGKPLKNYTMAWFDHSGRRCIASSGTSDKRAAERILAEKETEAALIGSGVVDPLLERFREEAARPGQEHLDDYLAACRDKQEAHGLAQKKRHLEWLFEATGAVKITDIRADVVDECLAALSEAGTAARTLNLKLECANACLNWCVRNGRLRTNPLKIITRRNELLDKRVDRRALTKKETKRLIEVARERAEALSTARLRPLWYMFPLLAGLRLGDMKRLTWKAIDLENEILEIRGGKAKRRVDRLPLHRDLIEEIRRVKPLNVLPSARVFPRPVCNGTRQKDFVRAGIPLENDRGEQADLHALRVTYGTRLALSGVMPAVHQRLMRHSTIELTMRYYTKLGISDLEEHGIGKLPGLDYVEEETQEDEAQAAS